MSERAPSSVPAPPTTPRVSFTDRAQFAAIRGVVGTLRLFGWRGASAVGRWLGRVAYAPIGIRRRIVERHVAAAFPEFSPAEVTACAVGAYESIGRTFIETAVLGGESSQQVLDAVRETEGWEVLQDALAQGQGVIAVGGHLGNWELAAAYLAARGVPMAAIARRMANPLFDQYVFDTRTSLGIEIIHDSAAIRRVPRALGEGKVVGFLCDQDALGLASTFVPFFGRPARTPRGPGVFALRLGAPVIFITCARRPDGFYRVSFTPVPVVETGNRDHDVDEIVRAFTRQLEADIRRTPAQYFWHHRRWKRQPPDTPAHLREP
jgi:KDO2-lipid IV(A) lauroyltransferase